MIDFFMMLSGLVDLLGKLFGGEKQDKPRQQPGCTRELK